MKRNKPFTPYEFQIKTLKIEKAALTAERDRYKAERDELIETADTAKSGVQMANPKRFMTRKNTEVLLI